MGWVSFNGVKMFIFILVFKNRIYELLYSPNRIEDIPSPLSSLRNLKVVKFFWVTLKYKGLGKFWETKKIQSQILYYNYERPHKFLDYLTPKECVGQESPMLKQKIYLSVLKMEQYSEPCSVAVKPCVILLNF